MDQFNRLIDIFIKLHDLMNRIYHIYLSVKASCHAYGGDF